MTTSATSVFDLERDDLLRRAFQLAGLFEASQTPGADDIALGADLLGMELDALQAEGILLRTVERTTLAITGGTEEYTLPVDTLDVFVGPDNVAGTFVPTTGAETVIRAISRHEWTQIPNKDASATPSLVYVEKGATVKVVFWPVPSDSGSFRYQKMRIVRDADTGAVTLDVARRWQKAICYAMAYQLALAKSKSLDRVGFLRNEAERLKEIARASDVEKMHGQFYVMRHV